MITSICDQYILDQFSTWRICSRERRKKQLDWLATNTDDITSHQIHLLLVRASKFAKWKTGFTNFSQSEAKAAEQYVQNLYMNVLNTCFLIIYPTLIIYLFIRQSVNLSIEVKTQKKQ